MLNLEELVFNSNRDCVILYSDYNSSAILKPIDLTAGGVISFQIKDGPDDGGKVCKWQYEELKRLEAEKIARKQAEFARSDRCRSYGPEKGGGCNGHGRGSILLVVMMNGIVIQIMKMLNLTLLRMSL